VQCVAVCCCALQFVAVCCSALHCVATNLIPIRCAVCCSVLQCVAVCCSALQCVAVCCNLSGHYKVCSVFLSVFFAHVYFPLSWISLLVGSICHHPTPQQIYIYTAMGLQHTYTQPRDIRTHSHVTTLSLNHLLLLCVCTRVRI